MPDDIDRLLTDADAALRREARLLRVRPLLRHVHHVAGEHRGEAGPDTTDQNEELIDREH